MRQHIFNAELVRVRTIAQDTKEFTLRTDVPLEYTAGQYAWLQLPQGVANDPSGDRRAFSMIPSALPHCFSIATRSTPSEYKQKLFRMAEGERLIVHAPFGSSFVLRDDQPSQLVCIAGGVAVSSFLATLHSVADRQLPVRAALIHLDREEERRTYEADLQALDHEQESFEYRPGLGLFSWDMVPSWVAPETAEWWIAGPQEMMDHVYRILCDKGVSFERMRFESNYPHSAHSLVEQDVATFKRDRKDLGLLAIEQSTHHTVITDNNGFILFVNDAAQKITGYSLSEMRGKTPRLWGGLMGQDFYRDFWRKLRRGESFQGELINRRKNGETYHAIAHISPIRGEDSRIIGYIATEEDISYRVELEHRLEEAGARREALLKHLGDGVMLIDRDGRISIMNDAAEKMLGYARGELLGKDYIDTIYEEDMQEVPVPPQERAVLRSGVEQSTIQVRYVFRRKDGGKFTALATYSPVTRRGEIFGTVVTLRDITKESEVDRAKSEFVSLASHQLRTPLSVVNWYSELLMRDEGGELNATQRNYVREIYRGNQRMVELVNALLDVSRIELGTFIVEPEPTDVLAVVNTVLGELAPSILEKKLAVAKQYQKDMPPVLVDPKLTRIIFQNLISNAVKYTPEGGSVSIAVASEQGALHITISDTGYGIPEDEQPKIFSKLFRARNVEKRYPDGTGLGLYIVKSVVDKVGGRVEFESTEGKGTIFRVILPAASGTSN